MSDRIELVTLAITDADRNVLLLHRRDHNQWQLPGGRRLYRESSDDAAARHAMEELNIDVELQRYIGKTTFTQGGVDYKCEWRQALVWQNDPILGDYEAYDGADYFNLMKYGIGLLGLSPNAALFARDLQQERIGLLDV